MRIILWLTALYLSIAPVLAQTGPQPLWEKLGKEINDTAGNTPQENPKSISDDQGNSIVVWEDRRNGFSNIYAQRVSGAGQLFWPANGVAVAPVNANQNVARLISDDSGGAIIVWQDYRNKNADIFAQRLNQNGARLWTDNGAPVAIAGAGQFAPALASDQKGGAIVTWHDYRGASGEDIYAQRISGQGQPVWAENGLVVCAAKGTQWYPQIVSDNNNGAIISWTDGRVSPADNNIYSQRLSASGQAVWEKDGLAVCDAPNNQEHPVMLKLDADSAVIAWNDSRNNNLDIFAQKINLAGKPLWPANGVPACVANYSQEDPRLAAEGNGGAIIVWTDLRQEKTKIFGQKILSNGDLAWSDQGRALTSSPGNQKNPKITKSAAAGWLVTWEDDRVDKNDLYAQKINSAGASVWAKDGVAIAQAGQKQQDADISVSASGALTVFWEDTRTGNFDIYGQQVSDLGGLLWPNNGQLICGASGAVAQQNARAILTDQNEVIIVFEDARSGYNNIYAQKINRAGQLAWGKNGVAVAKTEGDQARPGLVSDDAGGAIIAWEDWRLENQPVIRTQRISSFGKKLWPNSLAAAETISRQTKPALASDGSGGAVIIWEDNRNPLDLQDIYGQRVSRQGKLLWPGKGAPIISTSGNQVDAALAPDNAGGAIIAWTDYRHGDRNPDIFGQRLNPQGKQIWSPDGAAICSAPDVQRKPALSLEPQGGAIVAWTDKGGGSYDIYAQKISSSGQPQWMKDGIPVNQLSRTQQNPVFGPPNILAWEDYRLGNWDIYFGSLSSDGKLPWGESGVPAVSLPNTQYAVAAAAWKDKGAILAWEDYRSGESYEIYFQKISPDKQVAWLENGVKVESENGAKISQILADPDKDAFYVFWEDFTSGGKAIYGQKYQL